MFVYICIKIMKIQQNHQYYYLFMDLKYHQKGFV